MSAQSFILRRTVAHSSLLIPAPSPSFFHHRSIHPSCCRTKDALCLSEAGETSLSGDDGTSEAGPHLHRAQEAQPGKAEGNKIRPICQAYREEIALNKITSRRRHVALLSNRHVLSSKLVKRVELLQFRSMFFEHSKASKSAWGLFVILFTEDFLWKS